RLAAAERPSARRSSVGGLMSSLLAHQRLPGGVIRAVDLRMTIDAGITHQELARHAAARQSLRRHRRRGVPLPFMTLLAEERWADLEERRLHRAVRLVAVIAVLAHWLMLPEERPAVLG